MLIPTRLVPENGALVKSIFTAASGAASASAPVLAVGDAVSRARKAGSVEPVSSTTGAPPLAVRDEIDAYAAAALTSNTPAAAVILPLRALVPPRIVTPAPL